MRDNSGMVLATNQVMTMSCIHSLISGLAFVTTNQSTFKASGLAPLIFVYTSWRLRQFVMSDRAEINSLLWPRDAAMDN